jgi:hypothetical protein
MAAAIKAPATAISRATIQSTLNAYLASTTLLTKGSDVSELVVKTVLIALTQVRPISSYLALQVVQASPFTCHPSSSSIEAVPLIPTPVIAHD